MSFRITGLDPAPFTPLFELSDAELARRGARRMVVDAKPGFPDRIELRDLELGETALLVNHVHQPADTPYRSSHAIFVREGGAEPFDAVDEVPEVLARRPLSLRAFDADHMMVAAELVDGTAAAPAIHRLLEDPRAAYIQAHFAVRGCYAARVERA